MSRLDKATQWGMIGDVDVGEVIRRAHETLLVMQKIPGWLKDKTGGYLCVSSLVDGAVQYVAQIGTCANTDKATDYLGFCQEKARRLFRMFDAGHISSFQSKDEAVGKYAGAIVTGTWIISFSGLPQLADEALVIELALRCGLINVDQGALIASISSNKFVEALETAIKQG